MDEKPVFEKCPFCKVPWTAKVSPPIEYKCPHCGILITFRLAAKIKRRGRGPVRLSAL